MLKGRLARIYWSYTNDMLADALTKGKTSRAPLLEALRTGQWILKKPENVVYWQTHRPGSRETQPADQEPRPGGIPSAVSDKKAIPPPGGNRGASAGR